MERLATDIGALDRPFEERPEILQAIRMNRAVNVPLRVVNYLMLVMAIHAVVGAQLIGVQRSAALNVFADGAMDVPFAAMSDRLSTNLAGFAFQESEHDGLTENPTTVNLLFPLVGVHIAGGATDEGFIGFHRACHFVDAALVLRVSNAVEHEPCRLLSDLQRSGDFVRGNTVLAVRQHPHRAEPFVQANGAILEDRTDLDRELLPATKARPHQPRLEKRQFLALASGAFWPIRPFGLGNGFQADHGVRKIPDCSHQAAVNIEIFCFHDLSVLRYVV